MTTSDYPLPATRRAPKVLVVEDEPRLRELLQHTISDWGFGASGARSAEEAQRLMAADPHEIVVLDLHLPGRDGMEFFQEMHERWPTTRVIVLTAFGDLPAAREAIHLGVVDFLTKPCHLRDLDEALARARREVMPSTPAVTEPAAPPTAAVGTSLAEMERVHIFSVLEKNKGNRTAAAAELGISRRTLHYRLRQYRLEQPSKDRFRSS